MENKFKGQALNTNVIVQEIAQENKTQSGFDLKGYTDANEKQKAGIIVSVGTECPKTSEGNFTIQKGQKVIFDKFQATNFTQEGVTYLIVPYQCLIWTE